VRFLASDARLRTPKKVLPQINDYCPASSLILFDFVDLAKKFSKILAGVESTLQCPHQNPNLDAQYNDNCIESAHNWPTFRVVEYIDQQRLHGPFMRQMTSNQCHSRIRQQLENVSTSVDQLIGSIGQDVEFTLFILTKSNDISSQDRIAM